ncbi:MAG: hypothetical protein Q9219_007013 [cf. Caloplaca sp. 3 TL-2023]
MSGLDWGVGDLLAVTKLAWDLYHNCYLVAPDAPEDFRQLVNELASLQGALRTLRDDINSDKSFLERLGDNRKDMLERCLGSCFDTLNKLQKLVPEYRELGIDDGIQFWRKLRWVGKQGQIAELKSRIMVHTCNISLCMSSIGNTGSSSLMRIESSMIEALERQEVSETAVQAKENIDLVAPLRTAPSVTISPGVSNEPDSLDLQGIKRAFTGGTLVDSTLDSALDVTTARSNEISSYHGSPKVEISKSETRTSTPMRKASTSSEERNVRELSSGPLKRQEYYDGYPVKPGQGEKALMDGLHPGNERDDRPLSVVEAVTEAMQELSKIRQKEQSARPLRVVKEGPFHIPDHLLRERFQELAEEESSIHKLTTRDWLRARYNIPGMTDPVPQSSTSYHVSSKAKASANQAYIDLMKSSWIFRNIILDTSNVPSLTTGENRKLLYNLSDGINVSLRHFQPLDDHGKVFLMDRNINIWELLQPDEENLDGSSLFAELDNQRWITVEQEDAGEKNETVIRRIFVNAAIGAKKYRIKSRGAPYMLILFTKTGQSEPKVAICNQSGTICLTKDLTPTDVRERVNVGNPSPGAADLPKDLLLDFGEISLTVTFIGQDDERQFMELPRKYFNAVRRREPRHLDSAEETLLFNRSVEIFEQLKPTTLKFLNPQQRFQSCNVRVLEMRGREAWRTTRRMVINSSASEKRLWYNEIFLPLSNVRIRREGTVCAVTIKWSDCTHERSDQTDGHHNRVYNYVYDENDPSVVLHLQFRSSADAIDFENTILTLSFSPCLTWSIGPDLRQIYDLSDRGPSPQNYKAILITHNRLQWKYSELFYMYRDTDYIYTSSPPRVRFPFVYYTDYISSDVDKLYKPDPDAKTRFSHCEKKIGTVSVDFATEQLGFQFMSSLTPGHELVFFRRAVSVTTKNPSKWRKSFKAEKNSAAVHIWQTAQNKNLLLVRWEDNVKDMWMSTSLQFRTMEYAEDSNMANFPKLEYDRGSRINMVALVARDSKGQLRGNPKVGPVIICFETVQDREEFSAALDRKTPSSAMEKAPLYQLMHFK